jgi:hypothetical protein
MENMVNELVNIIIKITPYSGTYNIYDQSLYILPKILKKLITDYRLSASSIQLLILLSSEICLR